MDMDMDMEVEVEVEVEKWIAEFVVDYFAYMLYVIYCKYETCSYESCARIYEEQETDWRTLRYVTDMGGH